MAELKPDNVCEEVIFNEVFRAHSKDLHDFLYYKFGKENNPKDLVQEAFLKLWKNCQKVTVLKARAFLFTVANNQMINDISKKKTALTFAQEKPKELTYESPEFVMEENQFMGRLQNAIESLTEEQRVAFLLNRIEGKRHKEIAEMLGISSKAVEKRIYTALKKIRDQVGDI